MAENLALRQQLDPQPENSLAATVPHVDAIGRACAQKGFAYTMRRSFFIRTNEKSALHIFPGHAQLGLSLGSQTENPVRRCDGLRAVRDDHPRQLEMPDRLAHLFLPRDIEMACRLV